VDVTPRASLPGPTPRPPAVHVTIDRLVLRGLPSAARGAVTAALQEALAGHLQRLAQRGALGSSRTVDSLRLAELRVDGFAPPAAIDAGAPAGRRPRAEAAAHPQRIAATAGRALAQGIAR
jgi:hypothetical protein